MNNNIKSKLKTKNSRRKTKNRKNSRNYRLKTVGGVVEEIKVISYNISWGSMSGNTNDSTAIKLATECKDRPKSPNDPTVCLTNIRHFLDMQIATNPTIDFIALQEALNWKVIIEGSDNLQQMGYVHHKVAFKIPNGSLLYADLCTLYNHNKFKLLGVNCGNINKDKTDGRPYHMLFLEKKSNNKKYIFINFHNGHRINIDALQGNLLYDNFKDVSQIRTTTFEDIQDLPSKPIEAFMREHIFLEHTNVIMAGDTNDHGRSNFWQGIMPFASSNIPTLRNIVVNTKSAQPPNTCCVGRDSIRQRKGEDNLYGDYIMISNELEYIKPNYIPEDFEQNANIFITSDHLPVMAIIKEKKTTNLNIAARLTPRPPSTERPTHRSIRRSIKLPK
jgi:hypothetical protein